MKATPRAALSTATDVIATTMGELQLVPIWHATLALALADKIVLVDPWSKAPADRIPKADLILITDIHPDHLDVAAIDEARKSGTIIIGPAAAAKRVPDMIALGNGEQREALGIGITAVPMYNLKRGPEAGQLYHDKGRGNGYLLAIGDTKLYISGDTECTPEMRALRDVDLALVCMNLPYTMPPEEAAECVKAFRPAILVPYHYRGSELDTLAKALAGQEGIELRLRDFYRP